MSEWKVTRTGWLDYRIEATGWRAVLMLILFGFHLGFVIIGIPALIYLWLHK